MNDIPKTGWLTLFLDQFFKENDDAYFLHEISAFSQTNTSISIPEKLRAWVRLRYYDSKIVYGLIPQWNAEFLQEFDHHDRQFFSLLRLVAQISFESGYILGYRIDDSLMARLDFLYICASFLNEPRMMTHCQTLFLETDELKKIKKIHHIEIKVGNLFIKHFRIRTLPLLGLSLKNGLLFSNVRSFVKLSHLYFDHKVISEEKLLAIHNFAEKEKKLLIEALVSLAGRRHNIEHEDKTRFIQTIIQAGLSKSEAKTLLSSLNTPKTPQELAQNIRDSRIKHFILTQTLLNYFLDEGHDSLDLTLVTHLSIGLKIPKDSYLRLYSEVKQVWDTHHNTFISEAMGVSHSRVSPKLLKIIEKSVGENWHALLNEIKNTQVLTELFIKYSSTGSLTKEEYVMVKKQIFSLVKVIPSLAIFLLPGGAVLLPIFMKILPFSIVPDSFHQQTQNAHKPQMNETEAKNENETENHS